MRCANWPHIERPRLCQIVAKIKISLAFIVKRRRQSGLQDRRASFLYGTLHWLTRIVGEHQVFGVFRMIGDQLPNEPFRWICHDQIDAVCNCALVFARSQSPRRIYLAHFNCHSIRARTYESARSWRRKQFDGCFDTVQLENNLSTSDRCIPFNLCMEINETTDDEHDDSCVNRPNAEIDHAQRNSPQGGDDQSQRDQPDHQIEGPPMKPFKLGHFKWTPLAHLSMRPRIGMKNIWMHGIQDSRAPD